MYYSARYSARGEADADAIREQGTADFRGHLALISQGLAPYVLGGEYSIADTYLYMLASWHTGEKSVLYSRAPRLAAHSRLIAARPAVAKVDADHAQ
jgi:glutathione S-transferase